MDKIDRTILQRYVAGECTEAEKMHVEAWFNSFDQQSDVKDEKLDRILQSLDKKVKKPQPVKENYRLWVGAVAAVLIFIAFSVTFYYKNLSRHLPPSSSHITDVKAPQGSRAIVVLEDDSEYDLDKLRSGDTLRAKGYLITKSAKGELEYIRSAGSNKMVYNTLRTKTGGTTQIKLSDGTIVWLNAGSELRYPIDFGNGNREVFLKGEAYFEVRSIYAVGQKIPFYVRGEQQTIKVLGTKFNANFTATRHTALLEGKVTIANKGSQLGEFEKENFDVVLHPGDVYEDQHLRREEDIEHFVDWKEGYFDMNKSNLQQISKKLSNWYGVPIEVEPEIRDYELFGKISRQKDLQEVLDLLSQVAPVRFISENNVIKIAKTK